MTNEIELKGERALVLEVLKGEILIEIQKGSSCDSCAIHGVCSGQNRTFQHRIKTDGKFEKGDIIEVNISSGVKLMSSFIVFILPVIAMIAFYFIVRYAIELSENFAILASFGGLLLSGGLIYLLDKIYADKVHFEVMGKVKDEDSNE